MRVCVRVCAFVCVPVCECVYVYVCVCVCVFVCFWGGGRGAGLLGRDLLHGGSVWC